LSTKQTVGLAVRRRPRTTSPRAGTAGSVTTAVRKRPRAELAGALKLAMELMAIEGRSGQEQKVVDFIRKHLRAAGAPAGAIRTDNAHRKSLMGGEVGNLVLKLPGTFSAPRRLLMAHLDTVPICIGSKPTVRGNWVESADPRTGLGADDRAGTAVLLNTAIAILQGGLTHPPLTFLWTVQEETGLHGAHHVQVPLLGKPRLAFNWDGGPAEKMTLGATGGYRMSINVEGLASHAGGAPEQGVSAIAIASLAVADLVRGGWHGQVKKGNRTGTSNVGVIRGGEATNVVTPAVELQAEARSHDPTFRKRIVKAIEIAFRKAARQVRSTGGTSGKVAFEGRLDYESFRLEADEPCVLAAEEAIGAVGLTPLRAISNGGLDANWMTAHGIPTVTLGCGQVGIHTAGERMDIAAFESACQIALRLATGEA